MLASMQMLCAGSALAKETFAMPRSHDAAITGAGRTCLSTLRHRLLQTKACGRLPVSGLVD